MNAQRLISILCAVAVASVAVLGLSSCNLLHNENDWAFDKRGIDFPSSYVPDEVANKH